MNMKSFVRALLALGVVLVAFGHVKWIDYKHFPLDSKAWLIPFAIIPGYAALVMSWTGLLVERLSERLAGK